MLTKMETQWKVLPSLSHFFSLSAHPCFTWEELLSFLPSSPRIWFNFSKLTQQVGKKFLQDLWLNAFPYLPKLYEAIIRFFSRIERVEVCLGKRRAGRKEYEIFLVYVARNSPEVRWGGPPLLERSIVQWQQHFPIDLPEEFLSFFRIHNGFSKKRGEGILKADQLLPEYQKLISRQEKCGDKGKGPSEWRAHPKALYPFYHAGQGNGYQCFDLKERDHKDHADLLCVATAKDGAPCEEENERALPFVDWLIHYLD